MELDRHRITELTLKYVRRELSPEERVELEAWFDASPYNRERFEERIRVESLLEGIVVWENTRENMAAVEEGIDWSRVGEEPAPVREISRAPRRWGRLAAAAAVLAILVGGALWWESRKAGKSADIAGVGVSHDLPPGGNKAILTLASGSTIILDSASNGTLTRQGNTQVLKLGSGEIAYQNAAAAGKEVLYNSISTPKGGQYKIILSDGSKIWLNAATTLRYPIAFTGAARAVELISGEAYFEVVHDARRTFRVKVAGKEIEDLGTHFNVNAYSDEPTMNTTLLEGSIRVEQTTLSHAGQQVLVAKDGKLTVHRNVNVEEVVAWKNGYFEFTDADIKTVMRQLSRWYGVTVEYANVNDSTLFTGQIGRNLTASQVFQVLSAIGYHFTIQGDIIHVE